MATLQKIRNKAGILVAVVIGFALIAFILGDLFSSGPSVFDRKRLEVAEIGGESVNYIDFNNRIERLSNFYQMNYQLSSLDADQTEMIREEAWRELIREMVLEKTLDNLGIQVSDEELVTMLQGDSITAGGINVMLDEPHPIVRRMFTNPETGEFNRFQMINYFNAITNPVYKDEKKRWIFLENQIVDERLTQKYFTLIRKGLSPSALDAKYYARDNNSAVDFTFAYVNFNTIPDEEISVSSNEIEKYYTDHKNHFRQEEARSIEYVVFEITPTAEDDKRAKEYISQSITPFSRAENGISYVNSYSDYPYNNKNYSYDSLPVPVKDSLFFATPGTTVGPYFENEAYHLARLIEINYVSDSVKARHILITPSLERDETRSKAIADSLKELIDNGARFEQLAREFSGDESNREIGGDLGWFSEGMMVKPFNDATFEGSKGDVAVVKTNFGYHIIRIDDQSPRVRKIKVAFLTKEVTASDQTVAQYYSDAVDFRSKSDNLEKFRQACVEKNISPRFASDFGPGEKNLPGLEGAREVIRWAYENEETSVSQIFDLDERYIVAALTDVKEKGYASLSKVSTEIEVSIKKQKKLDKLAEQIKEKTAGANSIEDIAAKLEVQVNDASNIRLSNPYITGVGFEPAVVVQALAMETGSLSEPVKGDNGVFVININNVVKPDELDIDAARFRLSYGIESRVQFEGYQAIQDKAEIKDKRNKFF